MKRITTLALRCVLFYNKGALTSGHLPMNRPRSVSPAILAKPYQFARGTFGLGALALPTKA